jgi:hypothetical protein
MQRLQPVLLFLKRKGSGWQQKCNISKGENMNLLQKAGAFVHVHAGRQNPASHTRALSLVGCILAVLIAVSSCDLPWEIGDTGSSTSDTTVVVTGHTILDRQSLVRNLASCISDTTQIQNVYNAIPSVQLDGISYATFYSYIIALTRLHTNTEAVTSFRFVTKDESGQIMSTIAANASGFDNLLKATVPVELYYGSVQSSDQPVYIYIQEDANGSAYLSNVWVKECLNAFDFAGLYFAALEDQNPDAVASLIKGSQVPADGQFSSAVINYKARELTQYYHLKVQSPFPNYRLMSLDISQLSYLQPEVLDDISLSYQTRTVHFIRNTLNNFTIRDSVINPLATKDFYLYYNGEKTIRIGDRADSNQFLKLFGSPDSKILGALYSAGTNSGIIQQIIILSYSSATVTIRGNFYDDGSWDGQIVKIQLRSASLKFNLGMSINNGMTRDALMLLYPFADQTDYILSTTVDDQKYKMTFEFASDADRTVSDVQLQMLD